MLSAATAARPGKMTAPGRQHGFTLIEVLVTLVIFSVGLLAVAGLQAVSKRANYEGLQRTTASQIAYGLLEDMRVNGAALPTYVTAPNLGNGTIASEPQPDCRTMAAECSPAERAMHDLWVWERALDGHSTVGGSGAAGGIVDPTVCIGGPVAGDAGIYVVSIAWRGTVALSNPQRDACGAGSGKYGGNDEYRRVLRLPTFIDPNI